MTHLVAAWPQVRPDLVSVRVRVKIRVRFRARARVRVRVRARARVKGSKGWARPLALIGERINAVTQREQGAVNVST